MEVGQKKLLPQKVLEPFIAELLLEMVNECAQWSLFYLELVNCFYLLCSFLKVSF